MNRKKLFQRGLIAVFAVIFALGAVIVGAAVKTFSGTGKYIMSDFENQEIAQQRAIQRAKEDAQDQAGVYLTGFSKEVNANLVSDEISAVTNNILEIFDVKVEPKPFEVDGEPGIIWTATLSANIDPDGIFDFIKRDEKQKVTIVQQNTDLQDAIAKNDKQVEDLKEQYNRATSEAEKNRIREQMKQADRDFLANLKNKEANKLYYAKDYQGAIKLYNEAIEFNPNYAFAYNNRGTVYAKINKSERAVQDFNKAIELNPNDADYYTNRGVAYHYLGQNERAIQDFNKAIQFNPNNAEAYINRGNVYSDLGKYDRTIQDLNKAIKLNPNLAEAYYNIGNAYMEGFKQYELAVQNYNKAIQLNSNLAEAYINRGRAYKNLGQYERAIQDFDKSVQLNPNFYQAYYNRGLSYAIIGNFEQAIADINKAIKLKPNYALAYQIRGMCYHDIGDEEKAQADFAKAKELGYNG